MAVEKVWALHDFEAENPDEVSFKAGECIIVIEKDDAYGDGWWQGTNVRGESGLFPFTYTTLDQSQVPPAPTAGSSAEPGSTPQQASAKPGVMHSTMADIDNALTELQSDRRRGGRKSSDGPDGSRASFHSERTADMTNDDASELNHSPEDYASRSAAARAALAVNAQRDLQSAQEKERQDELRRREEAMRQFEEEEARQRELLLQKERDRQAQAAAGTLDLSRDEKPKVAPIAGVDMSDESDSEGSAGDLDDFADKTHSPLFGNLASPAAQKSNEDSQRAGGSSLKNEVTASASEEAPVVADQQGESAIERSAPTPTASDVAEAAADAAEPSIAPASSTAAAGPVSDGAPGGGSVAAMTAGVGAVAIAAGAAATGGTATITSRSVSPVPLAHRKVDSSLDSKSGDQRSIDESSRGQGSIAEESVAGGTGTAGTAATSLAGGGPETPKSTGAPFSNNALSPSQSAGSGLKPSGDPTEWTVEQVVEWGRSKAWDENSVLSKFIEHEITGDVLLEMDVNILKEIDIVAFGKRFQVANAIKELRKTVPGAEPLASPPIAGSVGSPPPGGLGVQGGPFSPVDALMPPPQSPRGAVPGASGVVAAAGSPSWADAQSLHQRGADASFDSGALNGNRSRPASSIGDGVNSNGQAYSGAGGIAAWQAQQANQRSRVPSQNPSEGYTRDSNGADDDEPLAALAERQLGAKNRRSTRSNEDTLGALPASPRKRESAGSSTRGGGDRTSFFGIGQRNRKPPPKVLAAGASEDDRHGKGTLSRLGFARSSRSVQSQASTHSDLKNNISLPTSSPNYDGGSDGTRRNRMSAQSGASGGTAEPRGHGREASIGSAGAGATPSDWNAAAAGVGPGAANSTAAAEGPVMARIRPVDLEGWMRKKGERYNSWKPRYLALKGSDLVILRDPQAEKIKGYVSMKGYKVIADENTNPGKYGFKILHETEKPHYFSSDDPILVREWMKGLMKATIGRDHSFPVISSYNNATMSLKEAQRMNPPPRPPSPTSRARTQRAKARQNTDQLTARDAAILMNLSGGQPAPVDGKGRPSLGGQPTSPYSPVSSRPPVARSGTGSSTSTKPVHNRLSALLSSSTKPQIPARSPSRRLANTSSTAQPAGRAAGNGGAASSRPRNARTDLGVTRFADDKQFDIHSKGRLAMEGRQRNHGLLPPEDMSKIERRSGVEVQAHPASQRPSLSHTDAARPSSEATDDAVYWRTPSLVQQASPWLGTLSEGGLSQPPMPQTSTGQDPSAVAQSRRERAHASETATTDMGRNAPPPKLQLAPTQLRPSLNDWGTTSLRNQRSESSLATARPFPAASPSPPFRDLQKLTVPGQLNESPPPISSGRRGSDEQQRPSTATTVAPPAPGFITDVLHSPKIARFFGAEVLTATRGSTPPSTMGNRVRLQQLHQHSPPPRPSTATNAGNDGNGRFFAPTPRRPDTPPGGLQPLILPSLRAHHASTSSLYVPLSAQYGRTSPHKSHAASPAGSNRGLSRPSTASGPLPSQGRLQNGSMPTDLGARERLRPNEPMSEWGQSSSFSVGTPPGRSLGANSSGPASSAVTLSTRELQLRAKQRR